jgi:GTP-binding protein
MPSDDGAFIDEARIYVRAGNGGDGAMSFRREKFVPYGGPDGGDGGRGGDVILRATHNVNTLASFRHQMHFRAEHGGHGGSARRHGKRGADLVIDVPIGTVVSDEHGVVADLTREGQTVAVARAGKGGLGNVHFKTATNRAPRMRRKGEPGEERWLTLELKTLGDVGFVGEPNAGKSSLLAAMSAAKPEIAPYPFTTIAPNLGVATVADVPFVVVDIPGLIRGAHAGVGLGHRFLRHVQRARLLVHVLDLAASDPKASYEMIRDELRLFDPLLLEKPRLVALNKIDLPEAQAKVAELDHALAEEGLDSYPVSALTREGVPELLAAIRGRLAAIPAEEVVEEANVRSYRLRPEDTGFAIERAPGGFVVRGRSVERAVVTADMESDEGLADLQRRLDRLGLFKELERAGVKPGDTVTIGDFELEWT